MSWFDNEVARCARDAHKRAMLDARAGIFRALYLCFKRGALEFAEDVPEGFELGNGERMPHNLTADQLVRWTNDRARRLPCLPEES